MNKTLKILLSISVFLFGFGLGMSLKAKQTGQTPLERLSPKQRYDEIITKRDTAIRLAKESGKYKCCIEPPCTMCFMSANKWNNFTPGTCACDDVIARGKEPCPQCINGMCQSQTENSCKIE